MSRKTLLVFLGLIATAALLLIGPQVNANSRERTFRARLDGYHETPAISTAATGQFRARVDAGETEIAYELEYSGLEGGNTLFAHVHFGQNNVAGGVSFFLCGGGGKPACPNGSATVTGMVAAGDVVGPAGQGITSGQLAEIIRAMRSGIAYANVHTQTFPAGEIRGQINDDSAER